MQQSSLFVYFCLFMSYLKLHILFMYKSKYNIKLVIIFIQICFMFCIVLKRVSSFMEKTVGTHAVPTVTTNLVTDLMDDAFMVV